MQVFIKLGMCRKNINPPKTMARYTCWAPLKKVSFKMQIQIRDECFRYSWMVWTGMPLPILLDKCLLVIHLVPSPSTEKLGCKQCSFLFKRHPYTTKKNRCWNESRNSLQVHSTGRRGTGMPGRWYWQTVHYKKAGNFNQISVSDNTKYSSWVPQIFLWCSNQKAQDELEPENEISRHPKMKLL